MAWMSLSLRKQNLKGSINEHTYNDIQLSRKLRQVHRHLSHEKSVFNAEMKKELADIKSTYMEVRKRRPSDPKSEEYSQWSQEYADAKEDYSAAKQDIQEYYEDLNTDQEEEAQDEEDTIQDSITREETQRDAESAELQSITDQIKTDIENNALKL